jgi:hypothetical protein
MSLEMAHKVILPPKKNYIPQFLKQRDINSYYICPLKSQSRDFGRQQKFTALPTWPILKDGAGTLY